MKVLIYCSIFFTLFAACSVQKSVPLSANLKDQIAMLPQDALVLGYVNVHQILSSPVYQLLYDETNADIFANKSYKEFVEKTGFDLRQHMREMLFAGKPTVVDDSEGMFVALGEFEVQKISDFIKNKDWEKQLKQTSYDNFILMNTDDDFTMCFADSHHFVAGTRQLVYNWLDAFSGKTDPSEVDVQILRRIEKLPDRESMWAIMDAGTLMETAEEEGIGIAKGLKNIQSADIAFTMDESFEAFGRINCSDKEKAELVHDALRGFLSSAKLTVSDDREVVDVLNKIGVDANDSVVTTTVKLNQEELKKLLRKRKILQQIEAV